MLGGQEEGSESMVDQQPKVSFTPIFEQIDYQSPRKVFELFASTKGNILIDSSDAGREAYGTNRYSYILIDPFEQYIYHALAFKDSDPLRILEQKATFFQLTPISHLPPFQGGMVGYFSYDLTHSYYPVRRPRQHDLKCPEVAMGFYDLVCSFDHFEKKAYIISSGLPERGESSRLLRANNRLRWFKQQIKRPILRISSMSHLLLPSDIQANFTKTAYLEAVQKVIAYIRAGDIFEANIAQRFSAVLPSSYREYELYKNLSLINPSPFSAFLNFGKYKIISASPERFICLQNRHVETRPIKGTRARHSDPVADAAAVSDLLSSEKDFAENIMIVDLMRNDLSIICEDHSVVVEKLCAHETYPTVHHLVSVIKGFLKQDENAFSILKAAFPGGSITGAPKIRAMQIIAEIEPHHRGPYCGSIILMGFDGNMDSSILIRTFVIVDNIITFHAGGAVVLDSDPMDEYEETLSKSFALRKALCERCDDSIN